MSTLPELFYTARRTGTPLVKIDTIDPAATMQGLAVGGALKTLLDDNMICSKHPEREPGHKEGQGTCAAPSAQGQALVFVWDAQNGLVGRGARARATLAKLAAALGAELAKKEAEAMGQSVPPVPVDLEAMSRGVTGMLDLARRLPTDSVVFALNTHRILEGEGQEALVAVQGVWNLRDQFKQNFRTLAFLSPTLALPPELQQDVLSFEDAPPDEARLQAIITERCEAAKVVVPEGGEMQRAVLATRGLSAFTAEQIVAMSLRKRGLDLEALWDRKKASISQVHGLSVLRGGERYKDVKDLEGLIDLCQRLQAGPEPMAIIVQIEEFEKAMAGSQSEGGDNTGIAQDRHLQMLDAMEENDWTGFICYGVPGCGKSLLIKAFANESGALPVKLDLNALSHKHVGVSEARIRMVMQTLLAAGGKGRVLFAASCNKLTAGLPPELKRRFRLGTWFFDLASRRGLDQMWMVHLAKAGLPAESPRPEDVGWSGANVRDCCDIARRLRCTPKEAARFIVPVMRSDPASVHQSRQLAAGRFLAAATGETYTPPEEGEGATGSREVKVL